MDVTLTRIPFNRPGKTGREEQYLLEAWASGHLSGDGPFTKRCHALLEDRFGVVKSLLTTSCTHALEMAGLLLDIQPGDEVIIPSFTFVSTVNAFVLRGAMPVFADIRPDTLNLDETRLEAHLTPRTKAIVPVHYAGIACEMNTITELAASCGAAIVEDNAHGLGAAYQGQLLGTFGALATQSFHETKNVTCGEGGALLINDAEFSTRAEIIREKGTNRARFLRGQVDKYTWVDIGSSYLPSDLLAAVLLAQLESFDEIQLARRRVWERYDEALRPWAETNGVGLPTVPAGCDQAYHLYYLMLPSLDARQGLIEHLRDLGIQAVFHYLPLHVSDMGRRYGGQPGDCPVTEDLSDRLVRLPFFNQLSDDEQARVIEAVLAFDVPLA